MSLRRTFLLALLLAIIPSAVVMAYEISITAAPYVEPPIGRCPAWSSSATWSMARRATGR